MSPVLRQAFILISRVLFADLRPAGRLYERTTEQSTKKYKNMPLDVVNIMRGEEVDSNKLCWTAEGTAPVCV